MVKLLGTTSKGKPATYACFVRHYDADHLASHPHQNVRDMTVLVSPTEDGTGFYNLALGVHFRGSAKPFGADGACSPDPDNPGALRCGVDCDGGRIDVTQREADTVLVGIPDGARVIGTNEEEPKRTGFGSDDKLFKLERTSGQACLEIAPDDIKKRIRHDK
jgi:hypothetical protein